MERKIDQQASMIEKEDEGADVAGLDPKHKAMLRVCMHVCMDVCMYVCMYAWMLVSMIGKQDEGADVADLDPKHKAMLRVCMHVCMVYMYVFIQRKMRAPMWRALIQSTRPC